MEKIFRINFYPTEWLVNTSHMTLEQRGLYIQVCSMIYANRGAIKNDPAHIGRAANCSPRKARVILKQLVDSGDLMEVQSDFITQKRCESELKAKRKHLESSANGARKTNEKKGESSKNNELASGEDDSSPSASILSCPSLNNNSTSTKEDSKHEGFLNKRNEIFDICYHLHDRDYRELHTEIACGWDVNGYLAPMFNEKVHTGVFVVPNKPAAAFKAWVAKYVKNNKL